MTTARKILMGMLATLAFATTAAAQDYLQDPRYGKSPEERQENALMLNYFNDAYRANLYDQAAGFLQKLMEREVSASQNLYINGANIYKTRISTSKSVQERNAYVDSLMMIYDARAKHFGDNATRGRGYILSQKANDYAAYRPADQENVFRLYKEAIAASGDNLDPSLVAVYFNLLAENYKQDLVETDELMAEYDRLAAFLDESPTPEKEEAKKQLDAILIASGAADCENLERLFKPQFEADPNNLDLVTKIMAMLSRGGCNTDFQLTVAEQYFKLNPSTQTAMALAAAFEDRGDHVKALNYLQEAIAKESNPTEKVNLLIRAASARLASGSPREAAELARQAIGINSESGYAHLILANAYAAGTSGCGEFDRQAAFWLVCDELNTARNLLSGDATQVANIDKMLGTYRSYWPSNEECFYRGLSSGQGYRVNCGWLSGGTTIRTIR